MRILPSGELEVFPEVMLVFVAGVRVFEGVSSGFDLEKDIGYVLEWHVMDAGADIDAVAGVKTDPIFRYTAYGVVNDLHPALSPLSTLLRAELRHPWNIGEKLGAH